MNSIDMWFPEDVRRVLTAVYLTQSNAMNALDNTDQYADAYRRGFEDAIRAIGIAFGLDTGGINVS